MFIGTQSFGEMGNHITSLAVLLSIWNDSGVYSIDTNRYVEPFKCLNPARLGLSNQLNHNWQLLANLYPFRWSLLKQNLRVTTALNEWVSCYQRSFSHSHDDNWLALVFGRKKNNCNCMSSPIPQSVMTVCSADIGDWQILIANQNHI